MPAPIRMTLNDLECPVQLKVCFTDGTLDVHECCGFRSWPCVTRWTWALAVSDIRYVANEVRAYAVCTNFRRFRGATNRRWAAKLGYLLFIHIMQHHLSDILICVAVCNTYYYERSYSGFLVILRQMTLKVYNVWKLHGRLMSHGLFADSVDMGLASLLYSLVIQQMQCSVKSTITGRAEKDVHSWRAVSLR